MQHNQLRLTARRRQHLSGHLQQIFIAGIFIRFEVAAFQEVHFIGAFGDAGDSRVVLANLPLVGEPPGLETGAVGEGNEVILVERFTVHYAV